MFRIKICGITRVDDARDAVAAGADAVGLNFYSGSPRAVSLSQAAAIAKVVPADVLKVGVFVNATLDQIATTCREVGLDAIQLHGDEPPEMLRQLTHWPVIRAFRCRARQRQPLDDYLQRCRELGQLPQMMLVDAWQADSYGGTGRVADWELVRSLTTSQGRANIALAGGITVENVFRAVREACPDAVDTASGVESSPGVKDRERMRAFVAEAKRAFEGVER